MDRKSLFEVFLGSPSFFTGGVVDGASPVFGGRNAEEMIEMMSFEGGFIDDSGLGSWGCFRGDNQAIEEKEERGNKDVYESQNESNKLDINSEIQCFGEVDKKNESNCQFGCPASSSKRGSPTDPHLILLDEVPMTPKDELIIIEKSLNNLLDSLDNEDDMYPQDYHYLSSLGSISFEEEPKLFEEKKEDKKFGQNLEKHNTHEIKKGKIKQNSELSKNSNRNSSNKDSTGDSTPENNPNKSILNPPKYFDHPPPNFISYHMKLNMSSDNLYCKLKKKIVREKTIKNRKKSEDMEKPMLREFKKYLKLKKDKKEFREIFIKDKEFWRRFLDGKKTPPFKYVQNGKEFAFNSFCQYLMMFIFSRDDISKLYEIFISDKSYLIQLMNKKKFKSEDDKHSYIIYLYNLNKIYNPNYKIKDLILDIDDDFP